MSNPIIELAELMSANQIYSSIRRRDADRAAAWDMLSASHYQTLPEPRRTILVVGAGASRDANLPNGPQLKDLIIEKMQINASTLSGVLKKLTSVYRLNENDLETNLLALSEFPGHDLRKIIGEIIGRTQCTLLSFEIIAHLFKHRFIDAIINFNFDELLDRSIDDELGAGEYHKIISDGDCPGILLNIDHLKDRQHELDLPVYIKPHGTISHKNSLRFTREQYYGLPTDIHQVISNLVSTLPVTMITFGFDMQSIEFIDLIQRAPQRSKAFHINLHDPISYNKLEEKLPNFASSSQLLPIQIGSDGAIKVGGADILTNLWERTHEIHKKSYDTRGIIRHKLLAALFYQDCSQGALSDDPQWLKDRVMTEIVLAICKGRGLLSINDLATGRSGKYYTKYINNARRVGQRESPPFTEMCTELGLRPISYGREMFLLGALPKKETIKKNLIVGEVEFKEKHIPKLLSALARSLSAERQETINSRQTDLTAWLKAIYDGEEVEIYSKADPVCDKIFRDPLPLTTGTAVDFYTNYILENAWDHALVVAETGKWLLKYKDSILSNKRARISLLVADETHEDKLREVFGKRIALFKRINWWEHNRHMTICLRERLPLGSIYFVRRMRSARISPLYLGPDDTREILDAFYAYLLKAKLDENTFLFSEPPEEVIHKIFALIEELGGD